MIKKEHAHLIKSSVLTNHLNNKLKIEQKESLFKEEESIFEKHDQILAKELGDLLFKHYPGYMWFVSVSSNQGVVKVLLGDVKGNYGFTIKIINVINDPSRKKVVMAGGEILERYKLHIGKKIDGESESLANISGITLFDEAKSSGTEKVKTLKVIQEIKSDIEKQVKNLKR